MKRILIAMALIATLGGCVVVPDHGYRGDHYDRGDGYYHGDRHSHDYNYRGEGDRDHG